MLSLLRSAQALSLAVALGGSQSLAPPQNQPQTAASILAQVREATGGAAWEHVAELRTEGTVLIAGKTGTITTVDDLRTGTNADRVELQGLGRVENHADMPTSDWAQDDAGDVLLTPGGKESWDIDDLSFVQEHHLVAALGAHYRGYNGKGFGGPSPEAWFTRLQKDVL
jgi:hypothetical protein